MTSKTPTSARETLENILINRFYELKYWQYQELEDIKIIAQSYEFTNLINLMNEKYKN